MRYKRRAKWTIIVLGILVAAFLAVAAGGAPRQCRHCFGAEEAAHMLVTHELKRRGQALTRDGLNINCGGVGHGLYGCALESGPCVVSAVVRLEHGRASYPWLLENAACRAV
jgi:hypothetical protein